MTHYGLSVCVCVSCLQSHTSCKHDAKLFASSLHPHKHLTSSRIFQSRLKQFWGKLNKYFRVLTRWLCCRLHNLPNSIIFSSQQPTSLLTDILKRLFLGCHWSWCIYKKNVLKKSTDISKSARGFLRKLSKSVELTGLRSLHNLH